MPILLQIIFGVLIGYPLIQLISALIVRPQRRELKALVHEIKSDNSFTDDDRSVLDWSLADSGSSVFLSLAFPIFAPVALAMWSWEVLRGRSGADIGTIEKETEHSYRLIAEMRREGSSKSKIWNDPRFDRARELTTDIQIKRMPITGVLTALIALPFLPLVFLAHGIKVSVSAFFNQSIRRALFSARLAFLGLAIR